MTKRNGSEPGVASLKEILLASTPPTENTQASDRRYAIVEGCAKLRRGPKPPFNQKRDKVRDLGLIDAGVWMQITGLVVGKALWPLFLHGEAGSGKTCIGLCLNDEYGGWLVEFPELLDLLLRIQRGEFWYSGPTGGRAYARDVWDDWTKANLTVLDEIGLRAPSDFSFETLKRLIDVREGKPAVFISNLSLSDIKGLYDDRIASRLASGTVIELQGDRRLSG